jgi:hypothetical protein
MAIDIGEHIKEGERQNKAKKEAVRNIAFQVLMGLIANNENGKEIPTLATDALTAAEIIMGD